MNKKEGENYIIIISVNFIIQKNTYSLALSAADFVFVILLD